MNGTIDLYQRTTSDLLSEYQVPVPPNFISTMWANVGKIRNRGIEVALDGEVIRTKDFTWRLGGNFSYNVNNFYLFPMTSIKEIIGIRGGLVQVFSRRRIL